MPTKKEHFVPRGYLKLFAIDPHTDNPFIHQIDLEDKIPAGEVPVKSVCYKNNLYEIYNGDGAIVAVNLIENTLKQSEDAFYACRNNLLNSYFVRSKQSLLSSQELEDITQMIALQILRLEEVLSVSKEMMTTLTNLPATTPLLHDFMSKLMLLPMALDFSSIPMTKEWKQIKRWSENPPLLSRIKKHLKELSCCLGHVKTKELLTCDRPVIIRTAHEDVFDFVIYPLSPQHVLYFYTANCPFPHTKNSVFELTPAELQFANEVIIANADRWVYSHKKLSNKFINSVKQKRKDLHTHAIKKNNVRYVFNSRSEVQTKRNLSNAKRNIGYTKNYSRR